MDKLQNLNQLVKKNDYYRKVVMTGKHSQVVVMCLKRGEEIGEEVHAGVDQIFIVAEGEGELLLDRKAFHLEENALAFVPAGSRHLVRNTGEKPLKLCTIYSPPEHAPNELEVKAPRAAKA
jgi:mannose-6-phosphate isomerase-like protein (cupin superfamily)